MQLIACKSCGTEISRKATNCPKCGHPNKEANHLSGKQVIGGLLVGILGILWFSGGGIEKQTASSMAKIHSQVATDAVDKYNISKRQGDAMQICVQAGIVGAAYLQAKDEVNYQAWKKTEAQDCKRAGLVK